MATTRAMSALVRRRLVSSATPLRHNTSIANAAFFSSSAHRAATPDGPPPANFRLARPERKESVWDQAGNYFLLTEMMRGMYVVLEQYFRPPLVDLITYYTKTDTD